MTDVDPDAFSEGDELTVRYEKRGQLPSHHERERERAVTVERTTRRSVWAHDSREELHIHHDGRVFGRTHSAAERGARAVLMGDVLDVE